MSYPVLYAPTADNFNNNGIGILGDCVSCLVTEEANGAFELEMQYPMDGIHYSEIVDRCIIKARPSQTAEPQLFRVYSISKPMSGLVTVSAEHISYDLSGIPVSPFTAYSASSAMLGLLQNAVTDCPFSFYTDKGTSAKFSVSAPGSIRSKLGGQEGSILDIYGGELEYDNYVVYLRESRGQNRGVSIRYGKNLTDIKQNRNCSNVATGVYPYWVDMETNEVLELPEKIINAQGTYDFVKIKTLDVTHEFEEKPTLAQMRQYARSYITNNNIGVPDVSLTVSFRQLEQSEEYKGMALLEKVSLFDTVNVEFPALGVSATAKAVKLVYNVILDRVESVSIGNVRSKITDTIANQKHDIEQNNKKPTASAVKKISASLLDKMMGAVGGSVRLIDTNNDGEPDELYIADSTDPANAQKVWRFNYLGWAASNNGYTGPFEMGATLNDGLLANFVTAAHLIAGTIKSNDNGKTFFLDLDGGVLKMNATEFSISGTKIDDYVENKVAELGANLTQEEVFNALTNNGTTMGIFLENGDLYINADYIKGGSIVAERPGYIPPTYDDMMKVLWHINFPDQFPIGQGEEYDLNSDGVVNRDDILLMNRVINGDVKMSDCPGSLKKPMTVAINPQNSEKPIRISGVNQWGTIVETHLGIGSRPNGVDCVVAQGTSGLWTYRKWESGLAECWRRESGTDNITSQWGTLFSSTSKRWGYVSYPFAFFDTPRVTWSITEGKCWGVIHTSGTKNTCPGITMVSNASRGSEPCGVSFYAVGYWKENANAV